MKILIHTTDEVGIKAITEHLQEAMKGESVDVVFSDKLDYHNFDLVHIFFDVSQFHPWGLGLVPVLIKLKMNQKKVVVTIGTILKKKDTYARNKLFAFFKKSALTISIPLISFFSDKVTVMIDEMKETLINDYHLNNKRIIVIPHGVH